MQQLYDMIPSEYKLDLPITQNALFRALSCSAELKKKEHFMHSKGKHPEHGQI